MNQNLRRKLNNIGAPVALMLILLSTLVPFFMAGNMMALKVYPYVFAAGAAALLVIRLFSPYRGDNLRQKRWYRMQAWAAIFFCAGAFFLFYAQGQLRDWLAFTLAGAVIQVITSIAIKE